MVKSERKEEEIERILLRCGIFPSKKGFAYLSKAISMFSGEHEGTCNLYRRVAEVFGVKPANVERCIRTCITEAAHKGTLQRLNDVFEMRLMESNDYLSNGDFVGIIATYLGFAKI